MKLQDSGKEMKMDKKAMANINEFLKANGVRELTPDELDRIIGGKSDEPVITPIREPGIFKEGMTCPHCGGTNTIGFSGNCLCLDCLTEFTV